MEHEMHNSQIFLSDKDQQVLIVSRTPGQNLLSMIASYMYYTRSYTFTAQHLQALNA